LVEDHPGTWLTVLYLALTSVGLVYTFAYYKRFGVNVLDYADTRDFLLAALREPLAIALALLPALGIFVIVRAHRALLRYSARYRAYYERRDARNERRYYRHLGGRAQYFDVGNTALVVSYAALFTLFYGANGARRVKRGEETRVRVAVVAGDLAAPAGRGPMLVGTTARYVFLYVPEQDSTYVVPAENVALLAIKARRERERTDRGLDHLRAHVRSWKPGAPPAHEP